jgi:hypothetical protein
MDVGIRPRDVTTITPPMMASVYYAINRDYKLDGDGDDFVRKSVEIWLSFDSTETIFNQ